VPSHPDADDPDRLVVPLFGRSAEALLPAVPPGDPLPDLRPLPRRGSVLTQTQGAGSRPSMRTRPIAVRRRWYRDLDATAAQHPPQSNSNPTGNLRLTQAGHPIDHRTYFRNQLFSTLTWAPTTTGRGVREDAVVQMEAVIDGRSLGELEFELSHATWRISGQGNVPTVLHWGPLFRTMRAEDLSGRVVTIEETSLGRYKLTIDVAPTGPFVL
jgi:hypothetical protein